MASDFDIHILPLHRQAGRDRLELPGVYAAVAPRRPARGRKQDRLILFLTFKDGLPFSKDRFAQLLKTMEQAYYDTPGSVTAAMRALIEDLNRLILNHNLKQSGGAEQVLAYLAMVVVRGGHLYLSQSGPSHGFLLDGDKIDYIHESEAAGRGLGVGRTPAVRFFQTPLSDGLLLVLTPQVPSGWNASTLKGAVGQPLKALRRRFLGQAGDHFTAVLIEARAGSGKLNLIRSAGALEEPQSAPPESPKTTPPPKPRPTPGKEPPPGRGDWTQVDVPEETPTPPPAVSRPPASRPPAAPPPESHRPRPAAPAQEPPPRRPRREPSPIVPLLLGAWQTLRRFLRRAAQSLHTFLARALPSEETLNIPTPFMAIAAVVVPLVVVTVAALVYSQIGRVQQYQYFYSQAEAQTQLALTEEDLNAQHTAWTNTIAYLDLAENYQTSEDSQALRLQAITALDDMDAVIRLDFKAAIAGSLSGNIQIRRMVATSRDLYMLDITSGSVIHAMLTGTHYEMDPEFRCGPGPIGSIIVGPIIDIAPLPPGIEAQAAIVAMDADGNLLYCFAEQPPLAVPLVPPDNNWGKPTAITIEDGNLYVLDPLTNAVWFYQGEDYQYRQPPYFYFIDKVPTLTNAIDLAVDRDSLYLLFTDGTTTTCTYSTLAEAPTFCNQPAEYADPRPGRQDGETIDGVVFFRIQHTQPPEPSLYYLDPINRAIYQFSLRLNLVGQFRPQTGFEPGPATAFAISPTRSIFLAQNNVVYIAFLP